MSVIRFDTIEIKEDSQKWVTLPNGAIRMPVTMTRAGVFKYQDSLGNVIHELRPEEEVFNQDSLSTFISLPVTDDHPPVMITSDNYNQYMKGMTDPEVKRDGQFMRSNMTVLDKGLQEKIKAGKRQLSLGYTVELEDSPGIWNGIKYDKIQRKIRGNHLSVVDVARAGSQVRIDSIDAPVLEHEDIKNDNQEGKMIKFDVGGVTYELDDKYSAMVHALTEKHKNDSSEIEKLKKDSEKVTEITKEKEALQGKFDALEAEKVKLDSKIKDIELEALKVEARKYLDKSVKLDGLTAIQVRELVIKTKTPEFKADGKSEEYITARYDAVIEMPIKSIRSSADFFQPSDQQPGDKFDGEVISTDLIIKKLEEENKKKASGGYFGGKN